MSGLVLACAGPRAEPSSTAAAAEVRPELTFEQRLWCAGRAIPPGLPAARVAELEAERSRALLELQAELGRGDELRWRSALGEAGTPDELWCAAARAAAALGRYDLAPQLGAGLEPVASAARAVGARAALHTLYGRWFQRPAELEAYFASVRAGPGTRLLLEALQSEEQRSRERLLAELAHQPAGAAAWLADPDPLVRSGAARILGQVFLRAGADASAALAALIAHLEVEHEALAFHEGLQAALPALERVDSDQPESTRLRALLIEIARAPGEPRTLSSARALVRLPWRKGGARDLGHLLTGVDALGAMLRGLAEADRLRGVNDADPLVAVLAALRELCAQASSSGLGADLRASLAHESVLEVLQDGGQDQAVRVSAAAALGPLARPSDVALLASVLDDPAVGAPVKHALLGALRGLLPELGRNAQGADELLAAVAELTGARDGDLRRRALELCADPGLEALVRRLDPAFLVARLELEDGREATREILRLIQRFGRPEMLGPLLSLPRFDRLAADPSLLEDLALALAHIAGSSGRDALSAATRLATLEAEETSLARLRRALALVSALDDQAAFELYPQEHRAIAAWTWRVVRAGVAPREATPAGLAFEQRLLEVHLPRGEKASGVDDVLGPFEAAHLAALLRADLFLGGVGRASKPQVEASFEGAQGLAASNELRLLVLRDRARFRAAANEGVKAMSDYRRLFEAGAAGEALLGIPDLRSAVELLVRLDAGSGAGSSATAGEAAGILRRIVGRASWRAEPASVRMQDLRDWAGTALAARDAGALRAVDQALADLPLTQAEPQGEREPSPLWFGLTREPGWFQELLDLRARVRLGLRELEAEG